MQHEASAKMLWVGEEEEGTRYRVQIVGRVGDQRLLAQKSAPDAGRSESKGSFGSFGSRASPASPPTGTLQRSGSMWSRSSSCHR